MKELFKSSCEVGKDLGDWFETAPSSWQPYKKVDVSQLHLSLHAAGVYRDMCDVYNSQSVAQLTNFWRMQKITQLRIHRHLHRIVCSKFTPNASHTTLDINQQIQDLVDAVCARVPFFLGDRTQPLLPHDSHHYPSVPQALKDSPTIETPWATSQYTLMMTICAQRCRREAGYC